MCDTAAEVQLLHYEAYSPCPTGTRGKKAVPSAVCTSDTDTQPRQPRVHLGGAAWAGAKASQSSRAAATYGSVTRLSA